MDGVPGISTPLRVIRELLSMSSNDDVKYITKEFVLANLRKSFPKTLLQQYSYPIIRVNKSLPASLNDSSFTISSSALAKSLTPHNKVDEKNKLEYLLNGRSKGSSRTIGVLVPLVYSYFF